LIRRCCLIHLKQFDLPTALVERGDSQRRQGGIVGEKYQRLARFGVFEADASELLRIIFRRIEAVQRDGVLSNNRNEVRGRLQACVRCRRYSHVC